MFVKTKRNKKGGKKVKKRVDIGVRTWYYIRALEKRASREGRGGHGNLENDTEKREKRQLILK